MSRSNNTELKGIATKYFEWSGEEGKLKYYDKEAKENILVDLPFTFIVLDKLHTISGFSDSDQSGFWSNEVRDIQNDKLVIQTAKNKWPAMYYGQAADVLNKGAKYAQSVYIAFKDESESLVIGNIKLKGSAIGSWIEFNKKADVYKVGCKISGAEAKKKGATKYFEPVFVEVSISEATNEAAIELDKQLQEYLTKYFERNGQASSPKASSSNDEQIIAETQAKADEVMKEERSEDKEWNKGLVRDDAPF